MTQSSLPLETLGRPDPLSVLESALILIFHDCIVHSCFANLHLLRDSTYRKFLIAQGYNLSPFFSAE